MKKNLTYVHPESEHASDEVADLFKECSAAEGEEFTTYNFEEYGQTTGAWVFEIIVQSADLIRVGWSSPSYIEDEDRRRGVGTYLNSYSVEGQGKALWVNGSSMKIKDTWVPGDVITCSVDFNADILNFYRNGRQLCQSISPGLIKGRVYTPCVSLGQGGKVLVNMGELPLIYNVDGHMPLSQCRNSKVKCLEGAIKKDIDYLGDCVVKAVLHNRDCSRCDKDKLKWILSCAVGHYASIIKREGKSFVTVQIVATSLCKIVAEIVGTEDGNLTSTFFAEFGHSFSESEEDKELYGWIFTLALRYFSMLYKVCPTHIMIREFLGVPPSFYEMDGGTLASQDILPAIPFLGPRSLEAVSYMLNFVDVPEHPLRTDTLTWIDDVLSVREHTYNDLDGLYPRVWWQIGMDAQPELFMAISNEASKRFGTAYELARNYQIDIVQFLYEHRILHGWLAALVKRSIGYMRTVVPPGLPSVAMLSNVFHVCARFVCQCGIFENECEGKALPPALLYGMDGIRGDFERVGGNSSHLLKAYCEKIPPVDGDSVVPPAWTVIDALSTLFSLAESHRIASLIGVSNELKRGFALYKFISQANSEAIENGDSEKVRATVKILGEVKAEIERLLKKKSYSVDFMVTRAEQDTFINIMKVYAEIISLTFSSGVDTDPLFLTQSYFDIVLGIYTFAKESIETFNLLSIAEKNGAAYSVLDLAATLLSDKRIVNPSIVGVIKMIVVGAIGCGNSSELRVLSSESSGPLRAKMIANALTNACDYEDDDDYVLDVCKALTGILTPESNNPMQDVVVEYFSSNNDTFSKYCDELFDMLNLMLSSFELALNHPFAVPADGSESISERNIDEDKIVPAIKKILFTVENSNALARGLESLSKVLPIVFWGRELNYTRMCEITGFVFSRMRPGSPVSELFNILLRVVGMHNMVACPPLTKMTIVVPFMSIAATMWKHDGIEAVYRFKRAEIPSSAFVWAISETNENDCPELPSFIQFCDACSRINDGSTLSAINEEGPLTPLEQAMSMVSLDDENLCEICFANKIDTEFVPCGHKSCRVCIERHVVTDQSCFFCKAHIDSYHKI